MYLEFLIQLRKNSCFLFAIFRFRKYQDPSQQNLGSGSKLAKSWIRILIVLNLSQLSVTFLVKVVTDLFLSYQLCTFDNHTARLTLSSSGPRGNAEGADGQGSLGPGPGGAGPRPRGWGQPRPHAAVHSHAPLRPTGQEAF